MSNVKQYIKPIVALSVIAIVVAIFLFTPIKEYVNPTAIQEFIESTGSFGPVIFGILYFIITLLFISAAAFSVLAGTLFGNVWGSIIVVIAATASAQVSFYIARYFGSSICEKLGKHGGIVEGLVNKVRTGVQQNSFKYFFVMRCLFLPYIPASYAAGIVKESSPSQFFFATLITNAIFSPAFVYFGESIFKGPKALLLPATLIILVLLVPKIVKSIQKKYNKTQQMY